MAQDIKSNQSPKKDIKVRTDDKGNVVLLFDNLEWANATNEQISDQVGNVFEYKQTYKKFPDGMINSDAKAETIEKTYYGVAIYPGDYQENIRNQPVTTVPAKKAKFTFNPLAMVKNVADAVAGKNKSDGYIGPSTSCEEIKTKNDNAQNIMEKFKNFIQALGFDEVEELKDLNDLIRLKKSSMNDSKMDFEYYPQSIISLLKTPYYKVMLNKAFAKYKVPAHCIAMISELLIEQLDQNSVVLHSQILDSNNMGDSAKYALKRFNNLLKTGEYKKPADRVAVNNSNSSNQSNKSWLDYSGISTQLFTTKTTTSTQTVDSTIVVPVSTPVQEKTDEEVADELGIDEVCFTYLYESLDFTAPKTKFADPSKIKTWVQLRDQIVELFNTEKNVDEFCRILDKELLMPKNGLYFRPGYEKAVETDIKFFVFGFENRKKGKSFSPVMDSNQEVIISVETQHSAAINSETISQAPVSSNTSQNSAENKSDQNTLIEGNSSISKVKLKKVLPDIKCSIEIKPNPDRFIQEAIANLTHIEPEWKNDNSSSTAFKAHVVNADVDTGNKDVKSLVGKFNINAEAVAKNQTQNMNKNQDDANNNTLKTPRVTRKTSQ